MSTTTTTTTSRTKTVKATTTSTTRNSFVDNNAATAESTTGGSNKKSRAALRRTTFLLFVVTAAAVVFLTCIRSERQFSIQEYGFAGGGEVDGDGDDDDDDEDDAGSTRPAAFVPPLRQPPGLKVPVPVFVATLHKSGTSTVYDYFRCGGYKSIHYKNKRPNVTSPKGRPTPVGPCLRENHERDLPLFRGCEPGDDVMVWSDVADLTHCWEPSIDALDNLYKYYPNSTIVLVHRDPNDWIDSVRRFFFPGHFYMMRVLKGCLANRSYFSDDDVKGSSSDVTEDDVVAWYLRQQEYVRSFAREHPSITFVDVPLESKNTATVLEERTGIPSSCWGHSNINKQHPPRKTTINKQ